MLAEREGTFRARTTSRWLWQRVHSRRLAMAGKCITSQERPSLVARVSNEEIGMRRGEGGRVDNGGED